MVSGKATSCGLIAAVAGLALSAPAMGQVEYECIVLDAFNTTSGLRETYVLDINEANMAVGRTTGGPGFYWTETQGMTAYGSGPIEAINNQGQVVVNGTLRLVYSLNTGQTTPLPPAPPPSYDLPWPSAINDAGVVVGSALICNCSNSTGMAVKPYLWDAVNGARDILVPSAREAIRVNNSGVVAGIIRYSAGLPDAFVYDVHTGVYTVLGTLLPPPSASSLWMTASDISDTGIVTGEHRNDNGTVYRGYTWSASQGFTFLNEAGAGYAAHVRPRGVSSDGVVVGRLETLSGQPRAFVWDPVKGTRDLNQITANIPASFVLRWATKINDNGWIVGYGDASSNGFGFPRKGFILKPVDSCYADCTGEGALTIADFACFQSKFVAGDPYADCNASGSLTIADFGCFQSRFAAGCP